MFFTQQKWWKEYFSFSKKERIATITLLGLMAIVFVLPGFYNGNKKSVDIKLLNAEVITAGDSVQKVYEDDEVASGFHTASFEERETSKAVSLFYFDPNTLDAEGWEKLGVHSKTIATIQKYIAKGGSFKKPEDIHRIYGLSKFMADKLEPFVQITVNAHMKFVPSATNEKFIPKESKPIIVEVNNADSSDLIALSGIGTKLSQRIINFRNKLGGFYSVAQIGETYGLPDSTFQKIKPQLLVNPSAIKKINLNTATIDELKQHPYIKWSLANAIIQFRQQHGLFTSVQSLQQIALVNTELFEKISPYLTIN